MKLGALSVMKASCRQVLTMEQRRNLRKAKLKNVSRTLVNKSPLCSGTWEIPSESFQLCFRRGEDAAGYAFTRAKKY